MNKPLISGYIGFWVFNPGETPPGRTIEEEVRWQIAEFNDKGLQQIILHLRFGHTIPYLSSRWAEVFSEIVTNCERYQIKLWIWDDDPWPPGFAGGQLTQRHPEFRARKLSAKVLKPSQAIGERWNLGPDCPIAVQAVSPEGEVIDLMDRVGTHATNWEVFDAYYAYMAFRRTRDKIEYPRANKNTPSWFLHWKPPSPEWQVSIFAINDGIYQYNGYVLDSLNPEAVRAWLDVNHGWYEKQFGTYFGRTIAGFYCAEPPIERWTEGLLDAFNENAGYDLMPWLPALQLDLGSVTAKVRSDYQTFQANRYAEAFVKQMADWCHQRDMKLMARFLYEESPLEEVVQGGSLAPAYRTVDVLASDSINSGQIGDSDHPCLNLGISKTFSIARQLGKTAYSEVGGPQGWQYESGNFDVLTDWSIAMGAQLVGSENLFYSVDGYRKQDCPPSLFYQRPQWQLSGKIHEQYDALLAEVTKAKDIRTIAVLFPRTSFYAAVNCFEEPATQGSAIALEDDLLSLHQALLEAHLDFDLVEEDLLTDAQFQSGELQIGQSHYTHIILPRASHITEATANKLSAAIGAGVQLHILQTGERCQVVPSGEPNASKAIELKLDGQKYNSVKKLIRALSPYDPLPSTVLRRSLRTADGQVQTLLYNTAQSAVDIAKWQTITSSKRSNSQHDPNYAESWLKPGELSIWEDTNDGKLVMPGLKPIGRAELGGHWEISPAQNTARLDRWGFYIDRGEAPLGDLVANPFLMETSLEAYHADRGGVNVSNYAVGTGPLYRWVEMAWPEHRAYASSLRKPPDGNRPILTPSLFPLRLIYRLCFHLEADVPEGLQLLRDSEWSGGNGRIFINASEVHDKDFKFERIYDAANQVASIDHCVKRGGLNQVIVAIDANSPQDGLLEPLRVIGDFSLEDRANGIHLKPPRRQLPLGCWTRLGYAHAATAIDYERTVELPDEWLQENTELWLDCGSVADAVVVYANDQIIGQRTRAPFRLKLENLNKNKQLLLRLRTYGGAANQIAGKSTPAGLLGPVTLEAWK